MTEQVLYTIAKKSNNGDLHFRKVRSWFFEQNNKFTNNLDEAILYQENWLPKLNNLESDEVLIKVSLNLDTQTIALLEN